MKALVALLFFASTAFAASPDCTDPLEAVRVEGNQAHNERQLTSALDGYFKTGATRPIASWIAEIHGAVSTISFREHSALFLVRAVIDFDQKTSADLDQAIRKSYFHLTGREQKNLNFFPAELVQ